MRASSARGESGYRESSSAQAAAARAGCFAFIQARAASSRASGASAEAGQVRASFSKDSALFAGSVVAGAARSRESSEAAAAEGAVTTGAGASPPGGGGGGGREVAQAVARSTASAAGRERRMDTGLLLLAEDLGHLAPEPAGGRVGLLAGEGGEPLQQLPLLLRELGGDLHLDADVLVAARPAAQGGDALPLQAEGLPGLGARAGILSLCGPSSVGTSTEVPSAAWAIDTGRSHTTSVSWRWKMG